MPKVLKQILEIIMSTISYMCMCYYGILYTYIGKNCLPLNNPENGQVYQPPDGTTAIFSCNNGFTKMGKSVLHCVNGNWSSSPPKCIKS